MSTYKAPLTDIRFALYDVLGAEALFAKLGYGDATRDVLDAVLEEAGRFTETVLAPLNSVGDEIGCSFDKASGEVTTPPGFREAYAQFIEGGWTGLTAAPEFGGQGLPHVDGRAVERDDQRRQPGLGKFPAAFAWRGGGAEAARRRLAARGLPQADRGRPLDRHHVPDRTALRHRPGPAQDPRRTQRRRQLFASPAPRSSSPPASTT